MKAIHNLIALALILSSAAHLGAATLQGPPQQIASSDQAREGLNTLQDNIQGDGTQKSFTDTDPGTETHLFYRIGVTPGN